MFEIFGLVLKNLENFGSYNFQIRRHIMTLGGVYSLQINLSGYAEYVGHISVHVRQRFLEKRCVGGGRIYIPCRNVKMLWKVRITYLNILNTFIYFVNMLWKVRIAYLNIQNHFKHRQPNGAMTLVIERDIPISMKKGKGLMKEREWTTILCSSS